MQTPKVCPVCGRDSIQPVKRTAFVKLHSEQDEPTEVIALRCGNGHVFLIAKEDINRPK